SGGGDGRRADSHLVSGAVVTRQFVAAVFMLAAFGLELLGMPGRNGEQNESAAAVRQVDGLLARREFAQALSLATANDARFPADPAVLWQMARAQGAIGNHIAEAAAWEAYLRRAPATTDVCYRLSDLYR